MPFRQDCELSPSEIEQWVDDAKRGMENALRANPQDVQSSTNGSWKLCKESKARQCSAPRSKNYSPCWTRKGNDRFHPPASYYRLDLCSIAFNTSLNKISFRLRWPLGRFDQPTTNTVSFMQLLHDSRGFDFIRVTPKRERILTAAEHTQAHISNCSKNSLPR
jgi:hypothetical protein